MAKSGLFTNQVEVNLASTTVLVEDVLVELGHVVDKARVDYPECEHAWRISKGSATIEIALLVREGAGWLQVSASVMTPGSQTDRAALWRKALLLNAERATIASFALRGDTLLLIGQRPSLDLDRSEVLALIESVSTDSDRYDDELVSEFGGRRGD
jgi:hypothetical protein